MSKRVLAFRLMLCFGFPASGQVQAPKRQSPFRHLFGAHLETDNLIQRYHDVSCALVVIQSGNSVGTGFYISPSGDVVTALHVLGSKTFQPEGNGFKINLQSPPAVAVRNSKELMIVPIAALDRTDGDVWGADLAVLRTGKSPPCWLQTGDDESARPGQHVLALGFPGLAFGSLSLYTGIISSRLKNELNVGVSTTGQALKSNIEYLRVQMPISPGVSGAPIIDDENRAIAVVTQAGAWSSDLDLLTQIQRMREAANQANTPSDLASMVAHLAEVFHDYSSPGYGDAVPLSYLRKGRQANPQPEPSAH